MTASQYARKQGYLRAKKIKPWRGYVCFEGIYTDSEDTPMIGLPPLILFDGRQYRMATFDKAMQYIKEVI